MVPWLARERLRKSERLSLSPRPRVDPREAATSRSQAICIHGTCGAHSLAPSISSRWVRAASRQSRGEKKDILFCDPSLSQSSALPSFLSELLDTHESASSPFHRSFISPSALAASSSSSRRACVPVPRFWLSRLSAGVAARRRVSKGASERYADLNLAKCRKDDLGLYRNVDDLWTCAGGKPRL